MEDDPSDDSPHTADVGIVTDTVPLIKCDGCGMEIDVSALPSFMQIACPNCAKEASIPARLGPFLLLKLIGTGGMGGVYIAKDETLGRNVAIKVMLKSYGEDSQFIENFRREAQAQARLNHPNVGQIYSFGQEKGQPYIVMELISGYQLDKMIRSDTKINQGLVMRVGAEIADGLRAADDAGMLHGDVKPENILLDEKGVAKLVDFGIASFAQQASDGGIYGTPYYIAPEKVKRQKVDFRSDIYSLGATLYHAITGHPPFEGDTPIEVVKARIGGKPPPIKTLRPDVDPQVEAILDRMLLEEPAARYPTYASLISDLRKSATSLGGGAISKKPPKTLRTRKRSSGLITSTDDGLSAPPAKSSGKPVLTIASKTPATGSSAEGEPTKKPSARKPPRPRKPGSGKKVAIAFLLILLLAGLGALGVYFKKERDRDLQRRRELYAIEQTKLKSDEIYANLMRVHSNVIAIAATAQAAITSVTNALVMIQNNESDLPGLLAYASAIAAPPPPELALLPNKGMPPAPPPTPSTNQPAIPAAQDSQPTTNAPQPIASQPATALDTPANQPSAEPAAQTNQPPAAPAQDANPALPPPPAQHSGPPPPPADEPEPVKAARESLVCFERIRIIAECSATHTASAKTTKDGIRNTPYADKAKTALAALTATNEAVVAMHQQATELRTTLDKRADQLKALREKKLAERAAQKKADEEAARKKADEEAAQQVLQQHKIAVDADILKIREFEAEIQENLTQYAYSKAVTTLEKRGRIVKTPEGLAELKTVTDRVKRLASIKDFIISQLSTEPLRWGWKDATGTLDILAVDQDTFKLTNNRQAAWTQATPAQILNIVDMLFARLADRPHPPSLMAEQNLNVAIFCYANRGLDPQAQVAISAMNRAAKYVEKAVQIKPGIKEDALRLMPDLPK